MSVFDSPLSYYQLYELQHAALSPLRAAADLARLQLGNPLNPLRYTPFGRTIQAGIEMFERATRRYAKPDFGIATTLVGGTRVAVRETVAWERPFCRLIHFERALPPRKYSDPKLLIVSPLSGHYATLLRGTVEAFLPNHDVYITDWVDARMVPLADGSFDLDDYIDYVISMLHALGGDVHVLGVCQPAVPVLAATALMEARGDAYAPTSMILMGGPIDTRLAPTAVNRLAEERGTAWFRDKAIMQVPFPHPGFMRAVYPGFLQLSGFMSMNLDRHVSAHQEYYAHLIKGDGDSATKHRSFYDEYLAVMDLPAEFFLQTVDTVFVRHALPNGEMTHRGERVDTAAIRNAFLLAIEGENDDISGIGQTKAALDITPNLPDDRKAYYLQPKVGHYGVFNGSRFRAEVAPRIADFIRSAEYAKRQPAKPKAEPAAAKAEAAVEPKVKPTAAEAPAVAAEEKKPTPAPAKAAAARKAKAPRAKAAVAVVEPKVKRAPARAAAAARETKPAPAKAAAAAPAVRSPVKATARRPRKSRG